MTPTAYYVRERTGRGVGAVYRLDPPLFGHEHVWITAVYQDPFGPETYIFGFDIETDYIESWGKLPGSMRGIKTNEEVLRNAGYKIVGG